jgi:hypothetical protein
MPPKRKPPVTFDEHLGAVIEGVAIPFGGREFLTGLTDWSSKTVDRRIRGQAPFLVSELEVVAHATGTPAHELVGTALRNYGGIEKLLQESVSDAERNVTPEDNVTYLGHRTPPLEAAASEGDRVPPKD